MKTLRNIAMTIGLTAVRVEEPIDWRRQIGRAHV